MWAEASDLLWESEPDGEVTWCGSRASHVSLTSAVRRTAAGKQHVLMAGDHSWGGDCGEITCLCFGKCVDYNGAPEEMAEVTCEALSLVPSCQARERECLREAP